MNNQRDLESPETDGAGPAQEPGPGYSARESTLRQQVIFFLKLVAVFGIIFIFFWWFEK